MHTPTHTNANAAAGGATLRSIRITAGLTLSGLATRADVDESTLSRFETGKRDISKPLLARVLQAIAADLVASSGRAA